MKARALLALALLASTAGAAELELAVDGRSRATIVLPDAPHVTERTAAAELAAYLRRVSGARFEIRAEAAADRKGTRIHVGATGAGRRAGCEATGGEGWRIRVEPDSVVLCGESPRGTLYAVYHFLEEELGVRWWTPFAESVPRRSTLRLAARARQGRPAFSMRDLSFNLAAGHDPDRFPARVRLNGHHAAVSPAFGGHLRFGLPYHVHTYHMFVPPDPLFETHPEFFTGLTRPRSEAPGQLCVSEPALQEHLVRRLHGFIEASRYRARRSEEVMPSLYAFSPMDWRGDCDCAPCAPLLEREGGETGPMLDAVNRLADSIREDYPEDAVVALAYRHTAEPPRTLEARDNVIVQYAPLFRQDFTKPLTDPANELVRRRLRGWTERAEHLWVWDYPMSYGVARGMPLPNLHVLGDNLRYYHAAGVTGVFMQTSHPIVGDMRDLKIWLLARLLEDPSADVDRLVREFTDGYYGGAGSIVRKYLQFLERAAAANPHRIGYLPEPEDWGYLDADVLVGAHRLFDEAEAAVGWQPTLLSRVRHARLSLDRATLLRWPYVFPGRATARGLDPEEIARRARRTAHEQITIRLDADSALRRREVDTWLRDAMEEIGYR